MVPGLGLLYTKLKNRERYVPLYRSPYKVLLESMNPCSEKPAAKTRKNERFECTKQVMELDASDDFPITILEWDGSRSFLVGVFTPP